MPGSPATSRSRNLTRPIRAVSPATPCTTTLRIISKGPKASTMQERTHNRRGQDRCGQPSASAWGRRASFTLVELLVSLSIMLILAVITIRLVNTSLDSDRLKAGSRELQSYLAGARDRAIYAGQPRGVRFIPDQADPYSVHSFVYIGAPANFSDGQPIWVTPGSTTIGPSLATIQTLYALANRGMLLPGTQIMLTQSGQNGA